MGGPYTVTVRAVDVNNQSPPLIPADLISLASTFPGVTNLPAPQALDPVTGIATFYPVRVLLGGISVRFTATDATLGLSAQSSDVLITPSNASLAYTLLVSLVNTAPAAVSAGQKGVPLVDLTFENPNSAPTYLLRGISLTVEDQDGAALSGQLDGLTALESGALNGTAAGTQIFYIPLSGAAAILDPQGSTHNSVTFHLTGDVAASAVARAFRLRLPGAASVMADNLSNTLGVVIASPLAPANFGQFNSSLVQVMENSLTESLRYYPNPFAAGRQNLTVDFSLFNDAAVSLKIYTLTGELVRAVADGVRLNGTGRQTLSWDGRNGAGYLVNNGVYYGVLDVGGKVMRLKIAVLK
jgi:hypothetical protein